MTPSERHVIDGWECGFCHDPGRLPDFERVNGMSLIQLLHGFFQFYSKFDYANQGTAPASRMMSEVDRKTYVH